MQPKAKITYFIVDWLRIKSACMTTVSKEAKTIPSNEWRRKLLISEHSPIRRSEITVVFEDIPSYIHTHLVRHNVGVTPYVSTSREDRTGVPRDERKQTDPVKMEMDLNIQSLINISLKRLCTCADATTRAYWEAAVEAIKEYDLDVYWSLVPQCVRYGGCPEMFSNCNLYKKFMETLPQGEEANLMARYDAFNEYREKTLSKKRR